MEDIYIVYFSPAGSTRQVSRILEVKLMEQSRNVAICDLGESGSGDRLIKQLEKQKDKFCLFIGSPVYVNRAVPPVMEFISRLPEMKGSCAVPFVTWGGVTSGIALFEMGKALAEKGYTLLGAVKVVALHSLMWQSDAPVGQGHPDQVDKNMVEELVTRVLSKLGDENADGIDLSMLAYQEPSIHAKMKEMSLDAARSHMPVLQVDAKTCTKCGECVQFCPVDAISLQPLPVFSNRCVLCYKCCKDCPVDAITADVKPLHEQIRQRAESFGEPPMTAFFV